MTRATGARFEDVVPVGEGVDGAGAEVAAPGLVAGVVGAGELGDVTS
jgi:hypothetical protein